MSAPRPRPNPRRFSTMSRSLQMRRINLQSMFIDLMILPLIAVMGEEY
ncbi:hypothetical protein IWX64_002438 [Arthrobacter sp. CAN_A212]|nr:hypothetical protein [Arthrobacter sp. CAN_C5]